ncbi:hypothetical protein F5050DRAFT_1736701 [Lentinula boryana]|uniref:Secreted protein n=1 Tax=Lentinula boryana TaxID=40481 RepID=A0ABQ8QMD3_9AGAR|nr:hypothetical protein F5050DRAFT_1736701 [Lentinula boryana]
MWFRSLLIAITFLISSRWPNSFTSVSKRFFASISSTSGTREGRSAMKDSITPLVRLLRNIHSDADGLSENTSVCSFVVVVSGVDPGAGFLTVPSM